MSEGLLGSRVWVVRSARVTVDSRVKVITPYLVRIAGTYRCPPGTPGRLIVACAPVAAGADGCPAFGATIAGGEVGQIDADGRTHTFAIDAGRTTDTEDGAEPEEYRHGALLRVVARLYYDEFAARFDWERFVRDGPGIRGPLWPRRQPVLAAVCGIVVVG